MIPLIWLVARKLGLYLLLDMDLFPAFDGLLMLCAESDAPVASRR